MPIANCWTWPAPASSSATARAGATPRNWRAKAPARSARWWRWNRPARPSASTAPCPPQLLVWGDHFDQHDTWQRYRAQTDAYWDALRRAGKRADVLDLPAAGIGGNSHFCMLDRNSDRIAELIVDWLNGLD